MEGHQEPPPSTLTAHPVVAYVLMCFPITWSVWFLAPLLTRGDWALEKAIIGLGFGPALAAIVLDRLRGTGARIGTRSWWALLSSAILGVVWGFWHLPPWTTRRDWFRPRPSPQRRSWR